MSLKVIGSNLGRPDDLGTYDHELYLGLASYLCSFAALTGFQENFNCYSYPKQPGSPQHPLTQYNDSAVLHAALQNLLMDFILAMFHLNEL